MSSFRFVDSQSKKKNDWDFTERYKKYERRTDRTDAEFEKLCNLSSIE